MKLTDEDGIDGPFNRAMGAKEKTAVKKDDVKVGEKYRARVSGKLVEVRVTEELGEAYDWRKNRSKHLGWRALNVATGRVITIRSAQRLRPLLDNARLLQVARAAKAPAKAAPSGYATVLGPEPTHAVVEIRTGGVAKKVYVIDREVAVACPLCGVKAVVPLTPEQLAEQPDDTTHVCHPGFDGCNHGFAMGGVK